MKSLSEEFLPESEIFAVEMIRKYCGGEMSSVYKELSVMSNGSPSLVHVT